MLKQRQRVTEQDFNILPQQDQYQLLKNEACRLMARKSFLYLFVLYKLQDFYVELTIDPTEKKVVLIEAFTNAKLLQPYLDCISLTTLTN